MMGYGSLCTSRALSSARGARAMRRIAYTEYEAV